VPPPSYIQLLFYFYLKIIRQKTHDFFFFFYIYKYVGSYLVLVGHW